MSLVASGVGLPPDLAQTLSTIGSGAYGQIEQNYKGAKNQLDQDALIRGNSGGVPSGSYGTQQLQRQQGLDTGNLEATLGGGLGNTAYNDTLQQRDFGQSMDIANQIGNALRPNTLEQIMAGIGGGAKAFGQVSPFLGMMKNPSQDPLAGIYGNV